MPGEHQKQPASAGIEGDNRTHDTAKAQPYMKPKGALDSGWIEARREEKEDPTSYTGGSSPDSVKAAKAHTQHEKA